MLVGKINSVLNKNYSFGRRLNEEEQKDFVENALNPALDYLGTKDMSMILHGTAFPQENNDLGVGSPFGYKAKEIIPFLKTYGFNSIQLGPVGVIRSAQQISPYNSTIGTKNYLFLNFEELTKDKYANILTQDDIDFAAQEGNFNKKNYAYSDFPEAFANYEYLIHIANKNFEKKFKNNDPNAVKLHDEYKKFILRKGNNIYKEALFEILDRTYGTDDYTKWNDLDKNLIEKLNKKEPNAINRYKKIVKRSKDFYKEYLFGQFLIDKQIKEHTDYRKSQNFKYINDFLVGFSPSDEWANQDLFLKNYRMGCPNGGPYGPQLWDVPVLNPKKLFNEDGTLGESGKYLKKKIDYALDNFDNIRIDHALGLVDPYIYNKNSVNITNGRIDLSRFEANNISYFHDIDPDGNYARILPEIVLPALEEHGIDKNSPVWENLGASTPKFDKVFYEENRLPGITQLEWMRGEDSLYNEDTALVGSHDSDPATKMIQKDWVRNSHAWNPLYLAGFLNSNPKRSQQRDEFCQKISIDDMERVKAKFAELFLTSDKIQISFADFFGIDKTYNQGGVENDTNWKLRLNNNYKDTYYKNLESEYPTALNIAEILRLAVQGKADINQVLKNRNSGEELTDKNPENIQKILDKLEHYALIFKQK